MITLIPTTPLADDDLVALVEENFRQALGEGAVKSVIVERFPGPERFVTVRVHPPLIESARSIARLLNMQMLRVEPGFGLIVDPAEG